MKILHVNTFDFGGAATAAIRLHEGLLAQDIDSKMLFKAGNSKKIFGSTYYRTPQRRWYWRLARKFGYGFTRAELLQQKIKGIPGDYEIVTLPVTDSDITKTKVYKEADIIHLHWVSDFLDWESFFRKNTKPVVWTCHDMNPIMGVFHYENDRHRNLKEFCELDSEIQALKKISILSHKSAIYPIAPSRWLQQEIDKSGLFGVNKASCITNGLPEHVFSPFDKKVIKEVLGFPVDKKIVLFVSDNVLNKRKGFDLLQNALSFFTFSYIQLVAIGYQHGDSADNNIIYTGHISEPRLLRQYYAAADVFVIPSREDNLPNTVMEAMACGTPVVGFDIGGIPDMVIDGVSGYRAKPEDANDLYEKIKKILEDDKARMEMGIQAREFILDKFRLDIQAIQYLHIYYDLLKN